MAWTVRNSAERWFLSVALTLCHVAAQDVNPNEPRTEKCDELDRMVLARTAGGQLDQAESLLSAIPAGLVTSSKQSCSGLILTDMAALMLISGRLAEAERFKVAIKGRSFSAPGTWRAPAGNRKSIWVSMSK